MDLVPRQDTSENSSNFLIFYAGYGMVYNMYIDEDGIVHWCFDDEVNPRMTQQIQNFIVENGYSAAALYDYAVSEGISADMYMDTLVAMDPNNGASDIEESGL